MSSADGEPIRVLHVDDDPDICEVVALHLEREREDLTVLTEHGTEAGLERLAEADVDCVVSDHDMPGTDGLEFLDAVRETDPALPFILFTGKGDEEIASEAISAGVTEYLQKGVGTDYYAVLANRIERAVAENRAKSALEESERVLSTLIANLPGMVYRCRDEEGWPMTFASEGGRELTGYDPERIVDGDVSWGEDIVVEDDRDGLRRSVRRALETDDPFEVTYGIATSDGDRKWVWERGRAVESDGDTAVLEGFITDITARKERERDLQREREFTTDVVNAIDDAFYVVSPGGAFLRWNDAINEVTGYTDEELSSMTVTDVFSPEHRETVVESAETVLEEGTVEFEAELLTKDGTRLPYEFRGSLVPGLADDHTAICGIGRDISEQRARERELERYRTLVESVGDSMYVLGADGRIEIVNRAMAERLGRSREELVGAYPTEFMPEEAVETGTGTVRSLFDDEDRAWDVFEFERERDDGTVEHLEDKVGVLTDERGDFVGSVGVLRDVSDRKERERQLEEFASVVSHDLRNPLNVVQGRLELAAETGELDHLDAAAVAADRMEQLIEDLLQLAREGRDLGTVQVVDVGEVARDAWDHVVAPNATLAIDSTGDLEADADRLAELFENLFRNAAEHAPAAVGDHVTVRVGVTDDGFYVEDDGVGVDPARRESLFDRGFTTSEDGTGFGLAIVENIAKAHGWRSTVTTGEDDGARFEVDT